MSSRVVVSSSEMLSVSALAARRLQPSLMAAAISASRRVPTLTCTVSNAVSCSRA